mgnify:CR=1 FL=1
MSHDWLKKCPRSHCFAASGVPFSPGGKGELWPRDFGKKLALKKASTDWLKYNCPRSHCFAASGAPFSPGGKGEFWPREFGKETHAIVEVDSLLYCREARENSGRASLEKKPMPLSK